MDKKKRRSITRTIILAVLVSAIAYTVYVTATKDTNKVINEGDVAPDFVLTDMEGNKHHLSDYRGQGVLLNFWGTWCPPCKEEMPALNNSYDKYKDQGVQVLSINIAQSDFEVQNFVDEYKLNFPVTIDHSKSVMRTYNVDQLPATFLIDPEGEIKKILTYGINEAEFDRSMESIKP